MSWTVISIPAKVLPSADAGGTTNGTTETVYQDSGGAAIVLRLPTAAELAGAFKRLSVFRVTAAGRVKTGGTYNFTATMYYGTSKTVSSNTQIASSGTVSLASLTTNWMIEATLIWDNSSKRITGWSRNLVHTTLEGIVTLDNAVTSATPDANDTLGFVCSSTFGTSSANNVAIMDVFNLALIG